MNSERLSVIVQAMKADMDKTKLLTRLDELIGALANVVSNPVEQHQNQLSQARKALLVAFEQSEFSNFPRTWRSTLEEIGIYDLLGDALRDKINQSFEKNQITVVEVRNTVQEIRTTLGNYDTAFSNIIGGFRTLKIAEKPPQAGEAELSVLMPRQAFDNELFAFAREVKAVDGAIKFFSELTTGSRAAPEIKQLSTSDPILLIAASAPTVLVLLEIVEQVVGLIEKTYTMRQAKAMTEVAEMDAKIIKDMGKEIEKRIEAGLVDIDKWLFGRYAAKGQRPKALTDERVNELKTESQKVLKAVAVRLDNGYKIDGDAGQLEPEAVPEGEKPDPAHEAARTRIQEIKDVAARIRYKQVPDSPVLQLPRPPKDEADENNGD